MGWHGRAEGVICASKGLARGHWTDAAGGRRDFRGLAVYAHVHGDGNDSENKQKGGGIEKRESVGRARDISERFWTTYGKLRSPGVGWRFGGGGGCILFNSSH